MTALARLHALGGRILWRTPGRFLLSTVLGGAYRLRCVLFHDIAETPSPFTEGLGITLTPRHFEERIRFLARHYVPIDLETLLAARDGRALPRRAVLVTFDDAYASIAHHAAPICREHSVPSVFFATAAFLDNHDLALENLVCFIANHHGFAPIRAAAARVLPDRSPDLRSLRDVSHAFVPRLSLAQRLEFKRALLDVTRLDLGDLARQAQLYLTSDQLRVLPDYGVEIGNHTYSHVRCRILSGPDLDREVGHNQQRLAEITGRAVRAFSVPYGSRADLTPELTAYLARSGHEAVFLVESLPNRRLTAPDPIYRVSVGARSDADAFSELEILPRLRAVRDAIRRPERSSIGA